MPSSRPAVVLTGDVVHSTDLSSADRAALPDLLKQGYAEVRATRPEALPHDVSIFGGDSWQIFVAEPGLGLLVAVYMRARVRERLNADARMVLALDRVDFLQPGNVSESDGPAFQRSGRALRSLERNVLLRYLVPEPLESAGAYRIAADGIADLVDYLAQQWTPAQAQALTHLLVEYPRERRQQEIGDAWRPAPISQPAVNKHLRGAGWDWIQRALTRYETLTATLMNETGVADHE